MSTTTEGKVPNLQATTGAALSPYGYCRHSVGMTQGCLQVPSGREGQVLGTADT